jgi:AmiR/NasT family two-component response regulator
MISINGGFALVALEADSLAAATIRDAAGESNISPVSIVADLATLIRTVESEKPALVILDLAQIGPDPAASVRSVLGAAPESCVIVTGADAPPRLISRAVSAGARAFLLRPFTSLELAATLRDTHRDFAEIRRLQRYEPCRRPREPEQAPGRTRRSGPAVRRRRGRARRSHGEQHRGPRRAHRGRR